LRLVRSTLRDALMIGASDIHMETIAAGLVIKFRIDGILSQIKFIQDTKQAEQAHLRVKVLPSSTSPSGASPRTDVSRRSTAVGRSTSASRSCPTFSAKMRCCAVLDKQSLYESTQQQLSWTASGSSRTTSGPCGACRTSLRHAACHGPTGSGKTTTLYAAITEINQRPDKIVTIEDPVEYQLAGVLQIPVNEKKGLTFARGCVRSCGTIRTRSCGEIRDPETANIAVQSALTGTSFLPPSTRTTYST